jgi:hypothetical protein
VVAGVAVVLVAFQETGRRGIVLVGEGSKYWVWITKKASWLVLGVVRVYEGLVVRF